MKSKLTESRHIDICKPINLLNKKWSDKNPPQTPQLNKKMKLGVRAIFCQGGTVNHLPKKFSQVTQIFTKCSVEKKRGPYDAIT